MTLADRKAPLAQLTSLRFFAALLVLLSHLVFFERSNSAGLHHLYDLLLRQGACGVTFFFILSGFILSHAYERSLADGSVSISAYFHRRIVRIYPLHLMVAIAFLGYLLLREDLPPGRTIALNLALLHSWVPDPLVHYSLNGPSWSLSNELFFYALFPFLLKLGRAALHGLFVAGMVAIVIGAGYAALTIQGYSPFVDWLFYAFPPTRLFEFIAGMLLYHAWQNGFARAWATTGSEIALVAVVVATMIVLEAFGVPLVFRYQLAFMPAMAALILVFAHGRGCLSRALASPGLQLLGEASFALYLIHRPLITFMERWAPGTFAGDSALALVMAMLAILGSLAVHTFVDQPLQHRLRRSGKSLIKGSPLPIGQ